MDSSKTEKTMCLLLAMPLPPLQITIRLHIEESTCFLDDFFTATEKARICIFCMFFTHNDNLLLYLYYYFHQLLGQYCTIFYKLFDVNINQVYIFKYIFKFVITLSLLTKSFTFLIKPQMI